MGSLELILQRGRLLLQRVAAWQSLRALEAEAAVVIRLVSVTAGVVSSRPVDKLRKGACALAILPQ
jgi:hypothetical protein